MSYACIMCQNDPFFIEEYRNPLIEFSRSILFSQSLQNPTHLDHNSFDSIFIQLLLYWTCLLSDAKNASSIHLTYYNALNNIKSIYLSSGKLMFS